MGDKCTLDPYACSSHCASCYISFHFAALSYSSMCCLACVPSMYIAVVMYKTSLPLNGSLGGLTGLLHPRQQTLGGCNAADSDTCWQVGFNSCCSCFVSLCRQAINNGGSPSAPTRLTKGPVQVLAGASAHLSVLLLQTAFWGHG